MERLSQLIETNCKAGRWEGVPVSKGGPQISHLMSADDVVLFGEASKAQAIVAQASLNEFCEASGQKLNVQKSSVYFSPNTNESTMAEICNTLAIQRTKDFGCYLGVLTMNGRMTKATFQDVITRLDKKLAGWKAKCLSLAGRTTLIQAAINAIPAYSVQSTRIARSVCDEIDRKIRRFLWGGTNLERKTHLVAWDVVTRETTDGGLGLRNMRQLNSAFLIKLGWRIETEPTALWARVLKAKYCKGHDLDNVVAGRYSCSNAWRGIMEALDLTRQGVGITMGDGRKIKFWSHRWIDGLKLQEQVINTVPVEQINNRVYDY